MTLKNTRIRLSLFLYVFVSFLIMPISGQQPQKLPVGFPDRSSNLDVLPGFITPPPGYGEVSFYWWVGDTLTHDRLLWQLEQLKDKSITGLQINYCHTDKGGNIYGLPYASQPALFSNTWWDLFKWFLPEVKKRNMSTSLSDYTLGSVGQGWYMDDILKENPELNGTKLESKQFDVAGNQDFVENVPESIVTAYAYEKLNETIFASGSVNLMPFIANSMLKWKSPSGNWKIILVYKTKVKTSFDPMNPLIGQKVTDHFYQPFEDHFPGESGKGLNFFFSDELDFGIRGFLWNEAFAAQFKKRKGYDVLPELSSLFVNLGPRSYKIRLDYNDVMVGLTEEGFFKPLYDWHTSRGMLFGCDHGGRGKDVTEFGDYFRTQRWMSGPGCDQPRLEKDIVKNKVASSISHLYERPRTWLEGYHSSNWGTSCEEVADATFANFAMGQNLLSLHGLYYTTHGSHWEWAAPDNHFRQPYWATMGDLLKCTERLSYVLSQGYHRCDVALIYPVSPVVADLKGSQSVTTAFSIASDLYTAGIDFDFMDFESLDRCQVHDKELNVSGEKFKVLVLPSMSAIRYSTVEKALEFFRSGGVVLAVGALPEVSDRIGGMDDKLQTMIKEMFGIVYSDKPEPGKVYSRQSKAGGTGMFIMNPVDVKKEVSKLIELDFKVLSGNTDSNVLHRVVGNRDLYFVYGIPKGTSCFFRSFGKVELWNPWDGSIQQLKVSEVTDKGTIIQLPGEKSEPQLLVFSPGNPEVIKNVSKTIITDSLMVGNDWEFELMPTLDNRFGDYSLPAFDGKIGVEVRKMKFAKATTTNALCYDSNFDDSNWSNVEVSYGPQFLMLGPLPNGTDTKMLESRLAKLDIVQMDQPVEFNGSNYFWEPYEFSWRWGLKDDLGHQGWHGMKGKVNNELFSFGKIDRSYSWMSICPLTSDSIGSIYYVWSTVVSPRKMKSNMRKSGLFPEKVFINHTQIDTTKQLVDLKSGANPLLLKYTNVGRGSFIFEDKQTKTAWKQTVPLATEWYLNPKVLPFDCTVQSGQFGWYCFMSPPGARAFYVQSKSKPQVWVAGKEYECQSGELESGRFVDKSLTIWKIVLPNSMLNSCKVALRIEQLPGFQGGSAIPEPIVFECGKGKVQIGNLAENESLKTYSGGMWYRKTIVINQEQAQSKISSIDLGEVVASAEVFVNGISVGRRLISPWTFDLSSKLNSGENQIEVLVYNTLGNHFFNTPSTYIGRIRSGLMGPVRLNFTK